MARSIFMLIGFISVTAAIAASGAQFRPGQWYADLVKPPWTPPNRVFAPVWTVLYVMIAIAGWLAWRNEGFGPAVAVWAVALAANGLWSWLFLGVYRVGTAMIDMALLLALIVALIALTWQTTRAAALLFLPYLAWVSYAATLNAGIWAMNP